jgi:hypothetical protein
MPAALAGTGTGTAETDISRQQPLRPKMGSRPAAAAAGAWALQATAPTACWSFAMTNYRRQAVDRRFQASHRPHPAAANHLPAAHPQNHPRRLSRQYLRRAVSHPKAVRFPPRAAKVRPPADLRRRLSRLKVRRSAAARQHRAIRPHRLHRPKVQASLQSLSQNRANRQAAYLTGR